MNKYILSLIILFISHLTFSSPTSIVVPQDMNVLCISEMPTTSFIGFSNEDSIGVRLVNSNGVDYMPISSNLVTIKMVPTLQKSAELLKNIGEEKELIFKLKDCKIYPDETFLCFSKQKITGDDGQLIDVVSLSSSKSQINSMGIEYKRVQITVRFKINDENHEVSMNYQPVECGISYK
jgi:hypothetical protein